MSNVATVGDSGITYTRLMTRPLCAAAARLKW